jgi:hypothetical protein
MTPSWRAKETASPSEEDSVPLPSPPSKEESLPSPIPVPTRTVMPKSAVKAPPTWREKPRRSDWVREDGCGVQCDGEVGRAGIPSEVGVCRPTPVPPTPQRARPPHCDGDRRLMPPPTPALPTLGDGVPRLRPPPTPEPPTPQRVRPPHCDSVRWLMPPPTPALPTPQRARPPLGDGVPRPRSLPTPAPPTPQHPLTV